MKRILGFFQLIRYPNLFFVMLTQVLFYFCVIKTQFIKFGIDGPRLTQFDFYLLVLSSVLIAAAGYIINDYFDLNIDKINKPERLIIDKLISRRWAMFFHLFISFIGLLLTAYVSWHLKNPFLLLFNSLTVILLWFYSTTFKRRLLSGNILISILTAWVIGVLYVAEVRWSLGEILPYQNAAMLNLYKLSAVYAGFAFIVSLIREIVKDLEDQDGDRKNNCETMPIVWGHIATKIFISVWILVLIGILVIMLFYTLFNGWFLMTAIILLALLIPLYLNFKKIHLASSPKDYHVISANLKLIMFFGILSMVTYLYHNS